jgi:hypothetical protein
MICGMAGHFPPCPRCPVSPTATGYTPWNAACIDAHILMFRLSTNFEHAPATMPMPVLDPMPPDPVRN